MNGFPGQLTAHALNGCQTTAWGGTLMPYFIKAYFTLQVRMSNVWKAVLS